ncbi:MAG: NAD-dependent epimerase/dehydratase family protein [Candidatus Heimdallarchaeaceae archaeon]
MKVLLTGAFGNVGQRTLKLLLKRGYEVRCFDQPNSRNMRIASEINRLGDYEVVWGDIRDLDLIDEIVKGVDSIIHLAAIIPPLAYAKPDLAYSVNVEGSLNLLRAAEKEKTPPRFIYASSIAVHGNRMKYDPPTKVDDPIDPLEYDNYATHKVIVERNLNESTIPWVILRFAAITPFELSWKIPDIMFDIPLDQRIEVVDSRDVALACVNAIDRDVVKEILFIGGGKGNQLYQREFIEKMLGVLGVGMLPENAFRQAKNIDDYYHCDWMDTKRAETLLQFQKHTFDDFIKDFKKLVRLRRFLISFFRPIARSVLLKKSPYYKKTNKKIQRKRTRKNISPTST